MRIALCLLLVLATPALADVEAGFDGYADLRLISAGGETSWLKGGLGKLRYGKGDDTAQLAVLFGQGYVRFTPELTAVASLRVAPGQRTAFDPLEMYLRYAPPASSRWAWSVKTGAFFAPFSLENTELGWEPYWTLTPSAINSWFGDELRTIGAEFALEWSGDAGTFTLMGSGFGDNDVAGVLMAERGWTMDDRPTGLLDRVPQPNATLILDGDTPPDRTPLFKEFDHRIGWYAGASWDDNQRWHLELIRYDNEADPSAHEDDYFAWHTRFWDAGAAAHFGHFAVLAQALTGETTITELPDPALTTDFDAAYLLLGWERGVWRLAVRGDMFRTRTQRLLPESENGRAVTASAGWEPVDWFRLTAEVVSLTSTRAERSVIGLDPRQVETQTQLSARFYLQ
ncbi:MAG TPA: hypothetical protein VGG48_15010 [Rhizomicrobium sp.]